MRVSSRVLHSNRGASTQRARRAGVGDAKLAHWPLLRAFHAHLATSGVIAGELVSAQQRPAVSLVGDRWVALFGVLSATQLVIWLAAVSSIGLMVFTRGQWMNTPGAAAYGLLLACFLIPGLVSLADAIDSRIGRCLLTPGCLRMGWPACYFSGLGRLSSSGRATVLWLTALLVVWSIDGIVQEWRGISLSGYPLFTGLPEGHKVTGSMGLDYGPKLAVLSPFLFEALRLHGRRLPLLWLAVPLLAVAVSLSASRYSAMLLLVSAGVCGVLWVRGRTSRSYWTPVLVVLLSLSGLLIPIALAPHLAERLALLGGSLHASQEELNIALAFRPELWKANWLVFSDHWINGVGLRGSAAAVNPLLASSALFPEAMLTRPWHPHLGVLEIATDSGLIGVMCYLVFVALIIKWMRAANRAQQGAVTTFLTIALLAMFPLSSALSMYSFPTGH